LQRSQSAGFGQKEQPMATPRKGSIASQASSSPRPSNSTCSTVKKPRPVSAMAPKTPGAPPQSASKLSARDTATKTKQEHTAEKIRQVTELKEKWAREKERKLSLYKVNRSKEMAAIHAANEASAEARRKEVDQKLQFLQAQKSAEQELLHSSLLDRTGSVALRENSERDRRRKSILLNEEILHKSREREEAIVQQRRQEEVLLLENRRLDFLAVREAKHIDASKRRESLVMRGETARQHKAASEELSRKAEEEERSRLDFRYELWKDREVEKSTRSKRDRESLAFRLDMWRTQKSAADETTILRSNQEIADITARREDWIALQVSLFLIVFPTRKLHCYTSRSTRNPLLSATGQAWLVASTSGASKEPLNRTVRSVYSSKRPICTRGS
jgi:hypothetical protein